jgi:hypothetical protein
MAAARVRGCAYECGYKYKSDAYPEQAFRQSLYDTAMAVRGRDTPDKPGVELTEAVHFIGAGDHPDHPGCALVKWAFKLKGGGETYISTHFAQLKAAVAESLPAGVLLAFVPLQENGKGNKITATKWKELVKETRGSELMGANNIFTSAFPGAANGRGSSSSTAAPVQKALTPLWYGYHVPVIYQLYTSGLPSGGRTHVSDPAAHELQNKKRADAYEKLALFPNTEQWCEVVKEAFQTWGAVEEVAVVVGDQLTRRGDVKFYVYVKTRPGHRCTVKNLQKMRADVIYKVLRSPPDWLRTIPEPQPSWISDDNSILRPWPLVPNKIIPSSIYRNGVLNKQLTSFMQQAAAQELALALVNEETALAVPQAREAQLTVFDIVQRVKSAATDTDGSMSAFVSVIKTMQVAAGTSSVEELTEELAVINEKIADLTTQKEGLEKTALKLQTTNICIKSQISDYDTLGQMLAMVRRNKWREMTDKLDPRLKADWQELNRQRDAIKLANMQLAKRERTSDDGRVSELLAYALHHYTNAGKAKHIWELLEELAENQGYTVSCKRKYDEVEQEEELEQ